MRIIQGQGNPIRQINRIRSKYDVLISVAVASILREARSAIFNGATLLLPTWFNLATPGSVLLPMVRCRNCFSFLQTIE